MKKELYANFRNAKVVKLLKIEVNEGEGTPENPNKRVSYFLSLKGDVLFHTDDTKRMFVGTDEMCQID